MGRRDYAGGANTLMLQTGISSTDMVFTTDAPLGWPDGLSGPFAAVIDRGQPAEEKVLITSRATSTFTVSIRGYDGTLATDHSGSAIELVITSIDADEANEHVNLSASVHGLALGDHVMGASSTATVTNKAMSGTQNTFTNIPLTALPDTQSAITGINTHLTTLDGQVAAETAARTSADSSLNTAVVNETTRAQGAESTLTTNLTTETTRATTAEALLAPKATPTFTGVVTLGQDATAGLQAATFQQVAAAIAAAMQTTPSWQVIPLSSNMTSYDNDTQLGIPKYWKDPWGIVRCRGLGLATGIRTHGSNLMVFPTGARPALNWVVPVITSGTSSAAVTTANAAAVNRVTILQTGEVQLSLVDLSTNDWISMDNIWFPTVL
jgi:hypothetical protein